jgi:hypothetical protein
MLLVLLVVVLIRWDGVLEVCDVVAVVTAAVFVLVVVALDELVS